MTHTVVISIDTPDCPDALAQLDYGEMERFVLFVVETVEASLEGFYNASTDSAVRFVVASVAVAGGEAALPTRALRSRGVM